MSRRTRTGIQGQGVGHRKGEREGQCDAVVLKRGEQRRAWGARGTGRERMGKKRVNDDDEASHTDAPCRGQYVTIAEEGHAAGMVGAGRGREKGGTGFRKGEQPNLRDRQGVGRT